MSCFKIIIVFRSFYDFQSIRNRMICMRRTSAVDFNTIVRQAVVWGGFRRVWIEIQHCAGEILCTQRSYRFSHNFMMHYSDSLNATGQITWKRRTNIIKTLWKTVLPMILELPWLSPMPKILSKLKASEQESNL